MVFSFSNFFPTQQQRRPRSVRVNEKKEDKVKRRDVEIEKKKGRKEMKRKEKKIIISSLEREQSKDPKTCTLHIVSTITKLGLISSIQTVWLNWRPSGPSCQTADWHYDFNTDIIFSIFKIFHQLSYYHSGLLKLNSYHFICNSLCCPLPSTTYISSCCFFPWVTQSDGPCFEYSWISLCNENTEHLKQLSTMLQNSVSWSKTIRCTCR